MKVVGLSNLAHKTGRSAEALDYYQQSLEIRQELSNHFGEGLPLANIGRMCAEQGDSEQAADYWQRALQLLAALNVPEAQEVATCLVELWKDSIEEPNVSVGNSQRKPLEQPKDGVVEVWR